MSSGRKESAGQQRANNKAGARNSSIGSKVLWPEVRPSHPCPICKRTSWCAVSIDGDKARCRHVSTGAYEEKKDDGGAPYYLHSLSERIDPPPPVPPATCDRADVAVLDRVYQRMLECLTLSDRHRKALLDRGLTGERIDLAGYRTWPLQGRAALLRRLQDDSPADELLSVPGVYVKEGRLALAGPPGLLIPVNDGDGRIAACMIRRDEAKGSDQRYLWLSSGTKGGPGPGCPPHLPVGSPARAETVRAVEGILKSDVTFSLDPSLACAGFSGCTNWRRSVPLLRRLGCRVVRLAIDGDWRTNGKVRQAMLAAIDGLPAAGFEVLVEDWDVSKAKGIDDALHASVEVAARPAGDVREEAAALDRPGRPRRATEDESQRRPPVIMVTHQQHDVTDRAIEALSADPDLYHRGHRLVRVIRDAPTKGRLIDRPPGSPSIASLQPTTLRERLSRYASWMEQRQGRSGPPKLVQVAPPLWCVGQVLDRARWPGLRPLEGVVEYPVLRADGTVLESPGYDKLTGLLYEPNHAYDPVPQQPTDDQVQAAVAEFRDLTFDFPFAGAAHFAAWLAAWLTLQARYAIDGPTPLFLVEASTAGSGKTLLLDLMAYGLTGRPMPRSSYPEDDDAEMRKSLTAVALAGDRFVMFDNLREGGAFGCASLDRALTSRTWKDRLLGTNENTQELPFDAVIFASGNNILVRGDLHRRVVPCRLRPDVERPEERTGFRHPDIIRHVRDYRRDLVLAGLVILRAHAAAEDHAALPALGGYESWSRVVRGAVHRATGTDPCETRADVRAADPATDVLAALLAAWATLPFGDDPDKGVTGREAIDFAQRASQAQWVYPDLNAALRLLTDDGAMPSNRTLGNRLATYRDRVVGGRAFGCRPSQGGYSRWFVRQIDQ